MMADTIAEFLKRLRPNGIHCLTSIIPDGKTTTQSFTDPDAAAVWARKQNIAGKGVYFHVNTTREALTKKASKADIASVDFLHIDIDPRTGENIAEEQARILDLLGDKLPAGIPEPSLIVFSGGGCQAFWRLAEPIHIDGDVAKAEEAERYNRALELTFGADDCHDVSRILRLPDLVNWPNKKKRSKGREPAEAKVIRWADDAPHPLASFKQAPTLAGVTTGKASSTRKARCPATGPAVVGPMGTAELEAWAEANGKTIQPHALAVLVHGVDPLDPNKYPSRSEALWAVLCGLARADVPDEMIVAAVIDPYNLVSECVRDKPNPTREAWGQLKNARADVERERLAPQWDRVTRNGDPLPSYWNARTALMLMGVECRYDKFRARHLVGHHELQEYVGEFSDHAERILRDEIIRRYAFDPGEIHTNKAVLSLCTENRFDSLSDHLNSLPEWDGKSRLDSWLIDHCGTQDSPYTRAAGATWLLGAVTRAFEPGTKFDYMLVLMGSQGAGKSSALRVLAGDEFFSDAAFLGAKDAREVLEVSAGVWMLECAELDGMGKRDVSTLKATIARQTDTGRPAYARSAVTAPRRFVLAGTTNERRFLQDHTGNRRFWPVDVTRIDLDRLATARDQILAEALARYRAGGCCLWLTGEAEVLARRVQGERAVVDQGFYDMLEFIKAEGERDGVRYVTSEFVYRQLGLDRRNRAGVVAHKVRAVMAALGWDAPRDPVRINGQKQRVYVWAGEGEPPEIGSNPF